MLDDLLLFAEIVERGSFAKAAEDLKLSPSTLSKRITALENKLGKPLMKRSARGIQLTAFGLQLRNDYATSLQAIRDGVTRSSNQTSHTLTLLCPQNLMVDALFSALSDFHKTHPEVTFNIEPGNANLLLSQKQFDLAIRVGDLADSAYIHKRLGNIAVRIVGSATHKKQHLFLPYTTAQLAGLPAVDLALAEYDQVSYVGDITLARKFVAAGHGAALLPMTEIQQLGTGTEAGVCYLSDVLFTRPISALWPFNPLPALSRDLVEKLQEYCEKTPVLCGKSIAL